MLLQDSAAAQGHGERQRLQHLFWSILIAECTDAMCVDIDDDADEAPAGSKCETYQPQCTPRESHRRGERGNNQAQTPDKLAEPAGRRAGVRARARVFGGLCGAVLRACET